MENNIKQGDQVVCISDHFPHLKEHGGTDAMYKPRVGEILIVDEVLGEFLRFDEYDTDDAHNWFFFNRFRKIRGEEMKDVLLDKGVELREQCPECRGWISSFPDITIRTFKGKRSQIYKWQCHSCEINFVQVKDYNR